MRVTPTTDPVVVVTSPSRADKRKPTNASLEIDVTCAESEKRLAGRTLVLEQAKKMRHLRGRQREKNKAMQLDDHFANNLRHCRGVALELKKEEHTNTTGEKKAGVSFPLTVLPCYAYLVHSISKILNPLQATLEKSERMLVPRQAVKKRNPKGRKEGKEKAIQLEKDEGKKTQDKKRAER